MLYVIYFGWPVIALWIVIMWLSWVYREKDQPVKKMPNPKVPQPQPRVATNIIYKRRYNF